MEKQELIDQIISMWKRHNQILVNLLRNIPNDGLIAKPYASRGRDVARQFTHINRVRLGWVHFHKTGQRPKLQRFDKGKPPAKREIIKMLNESGSEVEKFLSASLKGEVTVRRFNKKILRWIGYLLEHESHHRGQVMLALKQSGFRLPEEVTVKGIWGNWIFGK